MPATVQPHGPASRPNVVTVIALAKGHDGFTLRDVGEVFELDIDDPRFFGSTWFEPLDKDKEADKGFRRTPLDQRHTKET